MYHLSLAPLVLALCAWGSHAGRLPHIVGGRDVEYAGKWPFMASLQRYNTHSCGASLISKYWLVCAAHCTGEAPSTYSIVLGMHDRIAMSKGDPTRYQISSIINHPKWDNNPSKGFPNDISLVRISSPANLNSPYISTVVMAAQDDGFVGSECYIMGWGMTQGGGGDSRADILQEADANIYTNTACQQEWGSVIQPYHICIGDTGTSTACSSDSGGPVACDRDGVWILAGAASWVDGLCRTSKLSVYTRVSNYRAWIQANTGV